MRVLCCDGGWGNIKQQVIVNFASVLGCTIVGEIIFYAFICQELYLGHPNYVQYSTLRFPT